MQGLAGLEGNRVELRPSVFRPDWSLVTTEPARAALRGRDEARRCLPEAWLEALGALEDLVWRTSIKLFAQLGRAPTISELSAATAQAETSLKSVLAELQCRDLLAATDSTLEYVYPFTARETDHRVRLPGRTLNALCAVDALGVGAMLETDVTIESKCARCGSAIRLTTAKAGRTLEVASPTALVVWYEFSTYCSTAASSCCPEIAFFCSDEHLRASRSGRRGSRLTAHEALEVGRAIFAPVLAEPELPPV
jgi:hypothetical protein